MRQAESRDREDMNFDDAAHGLVKVQETHPDAELVIVGPDDYLLLRIPYTLTAEEADDIKAAFNSTIIRNRMTVISGDIEITRLSNLSQDIASMGLRQRFKFFGRDVYDAEAIDALIEGDAVKASEAADCFMDTLDDLDGKTPQSGVLGPPRTVGDLTIHEIALIPEDQVLPEWRGITKVVSVVPPAIDLVRSGAVEYKEVDGEMTRIDHRKHIHHHATCAIYDIPETPQGTCTCGAVD